MNEDKNLVEEIAKTMVKKKVMTIALSSLSFLLPFFLILFTLFVSVFIVLGIFDNQNNSNSSEGILFNSSLSTSYLLCESINVDGELYPLEEYVAGVVSAEAYTGEGMEALKAQAIAARTYAIVNTNNCSTSISNSSYDQNFNSNVNERALEATNATSGMVLTKNGQMFLSEYDSFYKGGNYSCTDSTCSVTYKKLPSNQENLVTVSSEYFSMIAGGHGRGMSQVASYYLAKLGYTYIEILKNFYDQDIEIAKLEMTSVNNNVGDNGSFINNNGAFSSYSASDGKTYLNYKQYYYKKVLNEHSQSAEWLSSSGCGLTSAAIIISSTNTSIDPVFLYNNYRAVEGSVNIQKYLTSYGYGVTSRPNKNISSYNNELKNHLKSGGTSILYAGSSCRYKKEKWTSSTGHYFVALDYNDNGTSNNFKDDLIYISNPGRNDNAVTSGWLNISDMGCVQVSYLVK